MYRDYLNLFAALLTSTALLGSAGCDGTDTDATDDDAAAPAEILESKTDLNPDGFDECTDAELQALADQVLCLEAEREAACEGSEAFDACMESNLYAFADESDACTLADGVVDETCLRAVAPPMEAPSNASVPLNCSWTKTVVDVAQGAYFDDPDYASNAYLSLYRTYGSNSTDAHIATWSKIPGLGWRNRCIVAIRGSDDWTDSVNNAESMVHTDCGELNGDCADGYYDAYTELGSLKDDLLELIDNGDCYDQVVITGHSLGGAVADIFAAHLYESDPDTFHSNYLSVETFGQTRAFDSTLADRYHSRISKTRWITLDDPVTQYPLIDYKHYGTGRLIYWGWSWTSFSMGWHFDGGLSQDYAPIGSVSYWNHPVGVYDDNLDYCH